MANNGHISRVETLQRLTAMLGPDRILAPGMSAPLEMPYGGFLVDQLIPGRRFLWLTWDWESNREGTGTVTGISAVLLSPDDKTEPTDEELRTTLQHYEGVSAAYAAERAHMPFPGENPRLRLAAGFDSMLSSSLCPEIVPRSQVN